MTESHVVEDALRAYVVSGELADARAEVQALMERVFERGGFDDEAVTALAVEEVRAARTGRSTAA